MQGSPSFDTWTVVFLIAAVQGFFIAFVLWHWKKGHPQGNRLLAVLLFLFAFSMVEYVLYWTKYLYLFPFMMDVSAHFTFLFGPLLFLYFRSIFDNHNIRGSDAWHFAPFLVGVALYLPLYGLDWASKQAFLKNNTGYPLNLWVVRVLVWARIAHMLFYVLWNYRYIWQQPRVGLSTGWARTLNGFFLGYALAYLSYFVLVRFPFFNLSWDYHISATMTAFIYLIAYAAYVQPAVFEGFNWTEPAASGKYKNSGLTPLASLSIAQKLAGIMESEKLYRDPELRLDDLAEHLQVGKHHVSQVINEQLGMSFFDYINHLRIADAQAMLAETTKRDMNIIEVAYAVGFNNKVSFNNTFKKATGMTPTEFRKKAQAA